MLSTEKGKGTEYFRRVSSFVLGSRSKKETSARVVNAMATSVPDADMATPLGNETNNFTKVCFAKASLLVGEAEGGFKVTCDT